MEITEHPRYELHAQLIEQERQIHSIQLQDEAKHTRPGQAFAQPRAPSMLEFGSTSKKELEKHFARASSGTSRDGGGGGADVGAESKISMQLEDSGHSIPDHAEAIERIRGTEDFVSRKGAQKPTRLGARLNAQPGESDEHLRIDEDSSKFSVIETLEDSSTFLDQDRRLENISSSSDTDSFSSHNMSLDGSEGMQAQAHQMPNRGLPMASGVQQGNEDPFERFRKWHARTSFPRDLFLHERGDQVGDDGDGSLTTGLSPGLPRQGCSQARVSSACSMESALSWDPNLIPSEWQIKGRIIEAFNLPRLQNREVGTFVCCISLIQDLRGVAYQRYLHLDHLIGSAAVLRNAPGSLQGLSLCAECKISCV